MKELSGLTGVEQYHWERAGYIIRRQALPTEMRQEMEAAGGDSLDVAPFMALARDALGGEAHCVFTELRQGCEGGGLWRPLGGPHGEAAARETHGAPTRLTLRVPFVRDESLCVLPGSHERHGRGEPHPLAGPSSSGICEEEGAVRVRLAPADLLMADSRLMGCERGGCAPLLTFCIYFVVDRIG